MKKNGYLRRFLALFLALVMIMADSSVTTFAATVGRVKQKSAAAESSSQCNVQINVAEELDVEQFLNDYKYIMLGTETPDKWPGIGATSSIEKISTTENVVLNDVAEGTEKKIYFVQGKESWQWGAYKTTGDTFQQGENKFKISVSETLDRLGFDADKYFKDVVEFYVYASNDILVKNTLGDAYEKIAQELGVSLKQIDTVLSLTAEGSTIPFIARYRKVSDYNKLAKLYNLDEIHLSNNEYAIIADFDSWIDIRNQGLELDTPIMINGYTLTPKYDECINGFINMTSSHVNMGIFVVSDEVLNGYVRETGMLVANYNANDDEGKQEIENMIIDLDNSPYASNTYIGASTKLSIYEGSIGLGAMITFIGLYLGIIFLIASAAILALKELSESTDNKERFRMLRKIGTDEKMLNKALFRQIGIFFLFPLVLAIIHSIFGIKFCLFILETFGKGELLKSIIMTAGIVVFVYGGYFVITYLCSKNIIKER